MQAMSELIPVNVVIADRSYRVRVSPKDEEVLRKTVKAINDKIIEFKTQFAGKDMQDYVSMVLIWFATEQNPGSPGQIENDNLASRLKTIERMLENHLSGS